MAPQYRHWLDDEVHYLITNEERSEFLRLTTDDARQSYMQRFWKIHTLIPGDVDGDRSREEHYRRLAYADGHFGGHSAGDGVHTDRGMVYITLGAPQQRELHAEAPHLRPIEIWFYENGSGLLPSHFSVVFYRPTFSEDFRLYSPYQDRPQKLVNGTDAVNDDKSAIHLIDNALGAEATRTVLSLIPGEPVNLRDPEPSLQSDILLSHIRDFRNLPQNRQRLEMRRSSLESVTHRILLHEDESNLATLVTRDAAGDSLHYVLALRNPQDLTFARAPDGHLRYDLQLKVDLSDANGKVIFHEIAPLTGGVSDAQQSALGQKRFAAEGRIPLTVGRFHLHVDLGDRSSGQHFTQEATVLVPPADQPLAISQVFFADDAPPMADDQRSLPFSLGGAKFSPRGGDDAAIPAGAPARVLFQLWETAGQAELLKGRKLKLEYLIGKPGDPERVEETQMVDRGGFDPQGALVIGRDFQTGTLTPGRYRFVVRVTNPETGATVAQSLSFDILSPEEKIAPKWTVIVPLHPRAEQAQTSAAETGH